MPLLLASVKQSLEAREETFPQEVASSAIRWQAERPHSIPDIDPAL